MRIVHVDTGRELRGGQRQLLLLARGLAERGYDQVISARKTGVLYAESLRQGLQTTRLAGLASEAAAADVVHAHDARAHTLAALVARSTPVVVSRRVAFPLGTGRLSRWKYARAKRILAVSEFVKSQLVAAGIPPDKIDVVLDGVRLPPDGNPVSRERLVIAPVADDPQKASALAAEACRAVEVEVKFSRDLEQDLPRASVFLYLSYSEGLGSAILAAMAHGVPVVASAVGGIPEIVDNGRTGLLVDNTAAAVAAALERMLQDPVSAAKLAEAARRRVRERFTDAIMVTETERAYQLALRS